MREFVLVLTMWGHTGEGGEWQFIGSQMTLNKSMPREQCEYMAHEDQWDESFDNEYYEIRRECFRLPN